MAEQEKRERVIKGLEDILGWSKPRNNVYLTNGMLREAESRIHDALALLQAQEPRVMTLGRDGFVYGVPYILEINESEARSWFEYGLYSHQGLKGNFDFINTTGRRRLMESDYGKTWRCWTSRPTDAQREVTPWMT